MVTDPYEAVSGAAPRTPTASLALTGPFSSIRWIAGTVFGAFVGLLVPAMIMAAKSSQAPAATPSRELPLIALVPILAAMVCGSCLQSFAFRRRVGVWAWTGSSAVGWIAGVALTTALPTSSPHFARLMAFACGLTIGLPLSIAQSMVLRGQITRPFVWAITHTLILGTLSLIMIVTAPLGIRNGAEPASPATPSAWIGLGACYLLIYAVASGFVMRWLLASRASSPGDAPAPPARENAAGA